MFDFVLLQKLLCSMADTRQRIHRILETPLRWPPPFPPSQIRSECFAI